MTELLTSQKIKEKALKLGFDLVGITAVKPSKHLDSFESWLKQGYSGQMIYLEKGLEKRKDPNLVLKGAKSMICCALLYYTKEKENFHDTDYGLISNYAWGKDYHKVLLEKLEALEKFIKLEIDPKAQTKSYVDTGPILERSYAQEAGLGWIGKNTCLINPKIGSWFFLGEILTDLVLTPNTPFTTDHCGTCTRCLDACPTQAFKSPGVLDATSCISYLTIEHRGSIPKEKRAGIGNHLSGCDICQEVCPHNQRPVPTSVNDFYPREILNQDGVGKISLEQIAQFTSEDFQSLFLESPIKRLKYEGLLRNAIIAMGNSENLKFARTLEVMKERIKDPMLQEHIDWALAKLKQTLTTTVQGLR
jgi:epoxyqueuosine reductase